MWQGQFSSAHLRVRCGPAVRDLNQGWTWIVPIRRQQEMLSSLFQALLLAQHPGLTTTQFSNSFVGVFFAFFFVCFNLIYRFEKEKHQFVVPFSYAFIGYSCICPDWGWNPQSQHIGTMLRPVELQKQFTFSGKSEKHRKAQVGKPNVLHSLPQAGINLMLISLCCFYLSFSFFF